MSSKVELQESFLNSLRHKFNSESGVDVTLWQLSYSYMKLIVNYTIKEKMNENKQIEILNKEMESDIFKSLIGFGFKKEFKIHDCSSDCEIRYIWECARDKTHPHGNVKIFASDLASSITYGKDDAGSVWTEFGWGKWELCTWAGQSELSFCKSFC